MARDACPECECCNHCGARHEDSAHSLDSCPLDPEVPKEAIEASLRAAGIDPKEKLSRVMRMLDLADRKQQAEQERDVLQAKVTELDAQVIYLRGSCGSCGEKMTGEWFDGTELTCPECGTEVVAEHMSDGAWTFPPVYDDGDETDV